MFRLTIPVEIQRLIKKMHPDLKRKPRASLDLIASDPSSGKVLFDELEGLRSFRVSSFRVIYKTTDPKRIEIIAIGPRSRIYEATVRILRKQRG
jgi:mRNA-degrading endonuclease RelE of RelBE toxin-antitoxin system